VRGGARRLGHTLGSSKRSYGDGNTAAVDRPGPQARHACWPSGRAAPGRKTVERVNIMLLLSCIGYIVQVYLLLRSPVEAVRLSQVRPRRTQGSAGSVGGGRATASCGECPPVARSTPRPCVRSPSRRRCREGVKTPLQVPCAPHTRSPACCDGTGHGPLRQNLRFLARIFSPAKTRVVSVIISTKISL